MGTSRALSVSGFILAIGSGATFALSGIFGSALMSSGWSPGAAVTLRIIFSALVLLAPTLVMMRGQWGLLRRAWRPILLFGLLAIVGCQLSFFFAVRFIPPSLAMLIEFMGPVLLMFWIWARTRVAPAPLTLVGAGAAVLGLAAVSGIGFGEGIHPLGLLFGLCAAVGNAAYYATAAATDHGVPPLPFVGLGLCIAAVLLAVVSAVGLLPFTMSSAPVLLAGAEVSPTLAIAGMVLISTVIAYVLGVAASRRLGAMLAGFTGYSEPIFGIFWTILLLSMLPTGMQWIGAALIICGLVAVKAGELLQSRRRAAAGRQGSRSGQGDTDRLSPSKTG